MDQDVDADTWLAERRAGIFPQLHSSSVDMYRPGQPRPPPSTTQQTSPSASKMHQDLLQLCSQRSNSSSVAELMKRLKDGGLLERHKFSNFHSDLTRPTDSDQLLDLDLPSGSWLRRPLTEQSQDLQAESSQQLKSPRGGNYFASSLHSHGPID